MCRTARISPVIAAMATLTVSAIMATLALTVITAVSLVPDPYRTPFLVGIALGTGMSLILLGVAIHRRSLNPTRHRPEDQTGNGSTSFALTLTISIRSKHEPRSTWRVNMDRLTIEQMIALLQRVTADLARKYRDTNAG